MYPEVPRIRDLSPCHRSVKINFVNHSALNDHITRVLNGNFSEYKGLHLTKNLPKTEKDPMSTNEQFICGAKDLKKF